MLKKKKEKKRGAGHMRNPSVATIFKYSFRILPSVTQNIPSILSHGDFSARCKPFKLVVGWSSRGLEKIRGR
jgi:hypothetical protein